MRQRNRDLLRILIRAQHLAAGAKPFVTVSERQTMIEIASREDAAGLLGYIVVKKSE